MPTGVYKRTKPFTEKQIETCRQNGRKAGIKNLAIACKLPRTQLQIETSVANITTYNKSGNKYCLSADTIICHHNDLCHGKKDPDDVTYMTVSEHASLHHKLRREAKKEQ